MEAFVQMTGYVGGDVNLRESATTLIADFRLASTPRVQRGGEWVDGPTTWITVKAFQAARAESRQQRPARRPGDRDRPAADGDLGAGRADV